MTQTTAPPLAPPSPPPSPVANAPPTRRRLVPNAATGGALALALLVAAGLLAPLLAPFAPERQFDPAAGSRLSPGSRRYLVTLRDGRSLLAEEVTTGDDALELTRRGRKASLLRSEISASTPNPTAIVFILGTDRLSRDCLSRVLHGARLSLLIGAAAAVLSALLGFMIGMTSALYGGLVDTTLMRCADAMLAFPPLFLLLLLLAIVDSSITATVIFLSGLGWMPVARIVRSEALAVLRSNFALVATSVGASLPQIAWRHVSPHLTAPICVATTLRVGEVMLLESALSFLGLGVPPPTPTWGNMMADGVGAGLDAWWIVTFPGGLLTSTVLSIHLLADSLRVSGGELRLRARGRC